MDRRAALVSGLSSAAKALYVASAAAERDEAAVVIVRNDADVEQMTADCRFFLAALEGMDDATVEQSVLPLPTLQIDPTGRFNPHLRVASARARALHALATGTARIIVASASALLPRVSPPDRLIKASIDLKTGQDISMSDLVELLVDAGFSREDPVDEHGEFSVRGGILDVYPAGEAQPARIEFVGDTIESIRLYDPASQRSVTTVAHVQVLPLREVVDEDATASVDDYLTVRSTPRIFVSEPEDVRAEAERFVDLLTGSDADGSGDGGSRAFEARSAVVSWEEVARRLASATSLEELELADDRPDRIHIGCQPATQFNGRVLDWVAEIRRLREQGDVVLFLAATAGLSERTVEMLAQYELTAVPLERAEATTGAAVLVATGELSRGFRLADAALQVFAESDVFEEEHRAVERRRQVARAFLSDLRDLKPGDFVVHVDHGIGVFVGLKQIAVGPASDVVQEFVELHYAADDKLFVPVERLDLVQRYTGATKPPVDRLGGTTWERAKTRVRKAMRDMAEELLKLYGARKTIPGFAFSADSHWQREFEEAFAYELTPDQQTAIADIKQDMETPTPMDRLLCGDVGYGKTEVAMRAAFKAVVDGKQVAVLAPTTVLAFQHAKTLRERFAAFPVRVDMVSRFRSKAEQKKTLTDLAEGRLDLIVGTHRLLSKDVRFRDLGLLVVDEEQRFGVAHKERIKQLRRRIDVLTMSATPIPRTLNMSLVGIRDMSIIETPPKDRLSIQTNVLKFDQQVIARAIRNELGRGGQVYFVHNRVESIFSIGALISRLVPEAKIAVAHGQMDEDGLERAMLEFIDRKHDVLLATTIIENGLDIPNVNTIIINRADRYGLSQLYQLRGRVGRSDRPAYAFLLIPPEDSLTPVARKRLSAIKEFSDLGSGFRVAALDLEIRGAGNLLGGEQSGHIDAIGFEMYMKLLEQTVRELKGEDIEEDLRATVNLRVDLRIDDDYIPDMNQRLMVYRQAAAARSDRELERLEEELRDRYGALPGSALDLLEFARIRILADRLGLESIDREAQAVVLKFRPQAKLDPARLVSVVRRRPDVTLAPPAILRLDLRTGQAPSSRRGGHAPGAGKGPQGRSWWTERATSGEVKPGFTRDEILKPAKENPRGDEGIFTRVGRLLRQLLDVR